MRQLLQLGISRWEDKTSVNTLLPNILTANTRFMLSATDHRHPHFIITCNFSIEPMITVFERASAILRTIYGERKMVKVLLRGNPIRLIPTLFDLTVIPPNLILKTIKHQRTVITGFTFILSTCVGTVF